MKLIIPFEDARPEDRKYIGGKGYSLALMMQKGINVPGGLCITTEVYSDYLSATGLKNRIALELNRKDFKDMRWEEIWDTALRIRNMFLNTPLSRKNQRTT